MSIAPWMVAFWRGIPTPSTYKVILSQLPSEQDWCAKSLLADTFPRGDAPAKGDIVVWWQGFSGKLYSMKILNRAKARDLHKREDGRVSLFSRPSRVRPVKQGRTAWLYQNSNEKMGVQQSISNTAFHRPGWEHNAILGVVSWPLLRGTLYEYYCCHQEEIVCKFCRLYPKFSEGHKEDDTERGTVLDRNDDYLAIDSSYKLQASSMESFRTLLDLGLLDLFSVIYLCFST